MLAISSLQAVAFQAPMMARSVGSQLRMSAADGMEGAAHETGFKVWDPLGLADLGSPATLAWMRHAELKHSRVAMAAFTGWLVGVGNQLALKNGHDGVHFPGLCSFSEGVSFADIAAAGGPLEQWQAVPEFGKFQIIGAIFIIEHQSEWKIKPHYMAPGGKPGDLKGLKNFWDPIGLTSKMDEKKKARQRLSEIKNGRLAMLGLVGCLVGGALPGSIPAPISWMSDAGAFTLPFGTYGSYH
eukprot:CAMPEP_0206156610 /NCGR_PEP_ID=MMETSP1474-20131121/3115_1 /ASSEMBLY_ACC=CAM_ASM_001110 /TAXON_ID=97495 /ORGANISM="Imantonia sp., Strain RCC918" /LENGTH=240 /DNA_ID=CAMNT_0053555747 /DNA_START=24 /DNA_END=746 /DNA_ORIENTATION=-